MMAGKGGAAVVVVTYDRIAIDALGTSFDAFAKPRRFGGRSSVELAGRLRAERGYQDAMGPAARWVLAMGVRFE